MEMDPVSKTLFFLAIWLFRIQEGGQRPETHWFWTTFIFDDGQLGWNVMIYNKEKKGKH
jgi:hypothetical protein